MQETQESWVQVQSLGWEDPLEDAKATHFSVHAWEILWTEDLAGYNPCGCKELDMTERACTHTHTNLVIDSLRFTFGITK